MWASYKLVHVLEAGWVQVLLQETAWAEAECGGRLQARARVLREAGLDPSSFRHEPIFCFETLLKVGALKDLIISRRILEGACVLCCD